MLLVAMLLVGRGGIADGQANPYQTLFYQSDGLRIAGYLYVPDGAGPFPVVIYNHGSREGQERTPVPFRYVAAPLRQAGYAVFVPERRGYGASDGQTFAADVGRDRGDRFVSRMRAEADDVLAALPFLATMSNLDLKRTAIMGWSLGGIVTIFASSRSDAFRAVVDQAGGALTWHASPAMQAALEQAVREVKAPVLFMDAQNDATTDAVTTLAKILEGANHPERLQVYPPFHPSAAATALAEQQGIAVGHLIFGSEGISLWQDDVLAFLNAYMK